MEKKNLLVMYNENLLMSIREVSCRRGEEKSELASTKEAKTRVAVVESRRGEEKK